MLILGIESSCDETALALVRLSSDLSSEILAEEVLSQTEIHIEYGGVVPELASREHLKNFPLMYESVFRKSNLSPEEIDLLAVTVGPGLKGCLLIGLGFAQGLAKAIAKPLVGVHHIEGHVLSPFLFDKSLPFPFLALVVSGGHTEIIKVISPGNYQLISRTIDDAAGEAFDKSANLLGFSYPGGPQLAALADTVTSSEFKLPEIMPTERDFSFSGLKTAILLLVKANPEFSKDEMLKAQLCWTIQKSIVDNLLGKMKKAVRDTGIKNLVLTGGVSANKLLRKEFSEIAGCRAWFGDFRHCIDNAAMIALAGGIRKMHNLPDYGIKTVFSRQPLAEYGSS